MCYAEGLATPTGVVCCCRWASPISLQKRRNSEGFLRPIRQIPSWLGQHLPLPVSALVLEVFVVSPFATSVFFAPLTCDLHVATAPQDNLVVLHQRWWSRGWCC